MKKSTKTASQLPAKELPEGAVCKYYPLEDVIPTPDNSRRIQPNSEKFIQLIESIREHGGNVVPGLGRPHPTLPGKIDLRAGGQRYVASQIAGVPQILLFVYDMTDKEAMDVTILENKHRNDLSPIEEARSILNMLKVGNSIEDIAGKMGETVKWVNRRKKLLDLAPCWLKALDDPKSEVFGASADKLELIARYDKETQEKLFKELGRDSDVWDTRSCTELKENISEYMMDMSAVAWDLNDALLVPKAGACSVCPKRSSCNPTLFDTDEVQKGKDTCLDRDCFKSKAAALLKRSMAKVQKETGKKPVQISTEEYPDWHARNEMPSMLTKNSYQIVKEDHPKGIPAVVVHGNGVGKPTFIVMAKKAGSSVTQKAGPKTMAEKRKGLDLRRSAMVINSIISKVEKSKLEDLRKPLTMERMFGLVIAWGTDGNYNGYSGHGFPWSRLETLNGKNLMEAAWHDIKWVIANSLRITGPVNQITPKDIINAKETALLLCLVWDDLMADAVKEIPEPKSWAKAEETPAAARKKTKAKKAKGSRKTKTPAPDPDGDDESASEDDAQD